MLVLTPWSGLVTLVVCPLVFLWAVYRRKRFLAVSSLAALLIPFNMPFVPFTGSINYWVVLWANWFGAGASFFMPESAALQLWRLSIWVLIVLTLISAALAFKRGEGPLLACLIPVFGVGFATLALWGSIFPLIRNSGEWKASLSSYSSVTR